MRPTTNHQRVAATYLWPLRLGYRDMRELKRMKVDPFCAPRTTCQSCLVKAAPFRACFWPSVFNTQSTDIYVCSDCRDLIISDLHGHTEPPAELGRHLVRLSKRALMHATRETLSGQTTDLELARRILRGRDGAFCHDCRSMGTTTACTVRFEDFACVVDVNRWVSCCIPCSMARIEGFKADILHREMTGRIAIGLQLRLVGLPRELADIIWLALCGLIDLGEAVINAA